MPDKKNKGKKPIFVYVSEELHKTLTELASEKEGGTLSSLVREVLVEYVKRKQSRRKRNALGKRKARNGATTK